MVTKRSHILKQTCSFLLLPDIKRLTISSSNIITHSNGYIKNDKYFFFYKSRSCKCSPETKLLEKQYRKIIVITQSNIKHFIKRSSVIFGRVKNGYHQDFQCFMVSIHFFHKMATLIKSFMSDKLESVVTSVI